MRSIVIGTALLVFGHSPCAAWAQVVQQEDSETITLGQEKPQPLPPSANLEETVAKIVNATNQFRAEHERPEVKAQDQLVQTAQDFADYMAEHDRYGHTADGQRPAQRVKAHDYAYCIVLENIAYQYRSTAINTDELAAKFVQGWENSPGHRKNMLDADVSQTGVAVARSEQTGYYYAVQLFARPRSESIDFEIVNRSGQTLEYTLGDETLSLPPRLVRSHGMCRPHTIDFRLASATEDSTSSQPKLKSINPQRGDQIVVRQVRGQIEIKQEGSGQPIKSN